MLDFKDNSPSGMVDHNNLRRHFEESQRVSKISDNIFIKAVDCHRHRGGVEKAVCRHYDLVQQREAVGLSTIHTIETSPG